MRYRASWCTINHSLPQHISIMSDAAQPTASSEPACPPATAAHSASSASPKRSRFHVDVPRVGPDGQPLRAGERRRLRKAMQWELQRAARRVERAEARRRRQERRRAGREAQTAQMPLSTGHGGTEITAQEASAADSAPGAPGETGVARPRPRMQRMDAPDAWPHRICLDMDFLAYMSDKDVTKAAKQVGTCYKDNRHGLHACQLHVTSLVPEIARRINDIERWDIHRHVEPYGAVFAPHDIVYLTSDSPSTLEDLDPAKVYIIGGLVDHNRHKGLTQRLAEERGLATARLPIGEHMHLVSRQVLTINHVLEILLAYLELRDWKAALLRVMPPRKLGESHRQRRKRRLMEQQEQKEEDREGENADEAEGDGVAVEEEDDSSGGEGSGEGSG